MDDLIPEKKQDAQIVESKPAAAVPDAAPADAPAGGAQAVPAQSPQRVGADDLPVIESSPVPASETAEPAPLPVEAATEPISVPAAYEHPWAVRYCHWLNAISVFVMVTSGLQIFDAFANFGPKVPEKDWFRIPSAVALGGWLGGALQWHFTFMWIFVATGAFYLAYEFLSGHYKTVLFMPRDIRGVWPMVRHYFLFGPKPAATEQYNPLQKLAYTSTVGFGVLSVLTGIVIYKPVQFSWLASLMGGFHLARLWHFLAMCGFLSFIPGHLLMVALHGWNNFYSMLIGWKKNPEYFQASGGK